MIARQDSLISSQWRKQLLGKNENKTGILNLKSSQIYHWQGRCHGRGLGETVPHSSQRLFL